MTIQNVIMLDEDSTKWYNDGMQAFISGIIIDECPYTESSAKDYWLAGYYYAIQETLNELIGDNNEQMLQ